jgi:alpha-aminoadipate carrier protein LysW
MATCPECDAEMEIDDDDLDEMEVGDPWDCDSCGTHLRVASLDPLDFDSDEDDDEEEDDEEEEVEEAGEADEEGDEDADDEEEVDGEWED